MSEDACEQAAAFTALVLAGRRGGEDPLARRCGVAYKCLAPAGGVPMVVRVLDALAASPSVGRIFVVLEDPAILEPLPGFQRWRSEQRCAALAGAATPSLSVRKALDEIPASLPMLVTTADHALLTPEIVASFCAAARATGADVVAGVTTAEVIQRAYPETQRTYLRFRDGACSGANLFALLTPAARRAVEFWRLVERDRKRPWRWCAPSAWARCSPICSVGSAWMLPWRAPRRSSAPGSRRCACRSPRPRSTSTNRLTWISSRRSSRRRAGG